MCVSWPPLATRLRSLGPLPRYGRGADAEVLCRLVDARSVHGPPRVHVCGVEVGWSARVCVRVGGLRARNAPCLYFPPVEVVGFVLRLHESQSGIPRSLEHRVFGRAIELHAIERANELHAFRHEATHRLAQFVVPSADAIQPTHI